MAISTYYCISLILTMITVRIKANAQNIVVKSSEGWETCGSMTASYNNTACDPTTSTCCEQKSVVLEQLLFGSICGFNFESFHFIVVFS